jgi:hypothetical protein
MGTGHERKSCILLLLLILTPAWNKVLSTNKPDDRWFFFLMANDPPRVSNRMLMVISKKLGTKLFIRPASQVIRPVGDAIFMQLLSRIE